MSVKGVFGRVHFKSMPLCVKILTVYSLVLAFFYLLFTVLVPSAYLLTLEFTGIYARLINIVSFVIVAAIAYGFLYRKTYVYELSLFWYSLTIINFFLNLMFGKSAMLSVISDSMKISFIFVLIINAVTIGYIFSKKGYFKQHKDYTHVWNTADRLFLYGMTLFIFLILIIFIGISVRFYTQTTKDIDTYLGNFEGLTAQESYSYCISKDVKNKDLCITTLAVVRSSPTIRKMCDRVQSDFYKFTCYYAIDSEGGKR